MAKRKYSRQVYQKNKKKRVASLFLKLIVFLFLLSIFSGMFLFLYYARDLPRPEKFTERQVTQSTKIYDRTGEVLLYDIFGEEKRIIVPLSEIPKYVQEAVIVTEDANFWKHFGLDIRAIIRAVLADLKLKEPAQGASTISQQLIRSSFLTREKTLKRKVREIILTIELERKYSKEEILEFYLNQVPFGSNAYGIEAASRTLFDKPVKDIGIAEAATLASLIKAPSRLSPYGEYKDELLQRKDYVLDRMANADYITHDQAQEAKNQTLRFSQILTPIKAPHFVMYIKDQLVRKYGEDFIRERGLRVYTSLDWELQEYAEKIVEQGAKDNGWMNAHNAALIAINPKTGEILTMVGSKSWFGDVSPKNCIPGKNCQFEPMINVAIRERQPGSAFKPFVYATAFEKGATPKTIVVDEETNFGKWGGKDYIPQNYDNLFRGPVTLRQALAQSLNVPSVKVLASLAGLKDSIENAKEFGITTLNRPSSFYGLSLVLGGGEVKLLDIASAYSVFANNGLKSSPVSIVRIEDALGNIVEENKKIPKRVLDSRVAGIINDILSDNDARAPMFGYYSPLYFPEYDVAAKTGTTQNWRDAWTIGYSASIVAGVWVGNNDNTPMAKQPGVMLSSPMWHQFMEKALLRFPKENLNKT